MTYNYHQAVDYILQIPRFTSKNDLEETRSFLKDLGNPEEGFWIIHVAGTNGKGSVCYYCDVLLQAEGKTVGRFTSPHLERINERMVMNGKEIGDEAFLESFHQILHVVEERMAKGHPHPTFFEFIFGMALLAFQREKVEYVVLETGLGGRLDATNAVAHPMATVITPIGYDHMKQLGNTLGQIAYEKAGIIKEGVPLVFASTTTASDEVIEARAKALHSPFLKIEKEDLQIEKVEDNGIAFSIKRDYYGKGLWTLKTGGVYQPYNALLALEAVRIVLREMKTKGLTHERVSPADAGGGNPLSQKQIAKWRQALAKGVWMGRMEEVRPKVYLDGAHNLNAILGFNESMAYDISPKIIVFGAVADKDVEAMVRALAEGLTKSSVERVIVTTVSDSRGVRSEELKKLFETYTDRPIVNIENPREAMSVAIKQQGERKIYCLGSLYLIGELRRTLAT